MKESKKRAYIMNILKRLKSKYKDQMKTSLEHKSLWELFVATILSVQSQDATVNKVTPELFKRFKSPEDMAKARYEDLYPYINKIGLYKTKAKNLVESSKIIVSKYGSKIPSTLNELMELPGVGRKVANVILSEGFGINEGMAIDTHCITVSNRLGLVRTSNPLKIEKELTSITPKEEWNNISNLFIALGRDTCKKRKPECYRCVLNDICLYKHKNLINGS
ncbi:MAG: endonuclease III [Candidatus Micrarchaeota archaeon]|nr:MAG: endonuclease III [Candidatus Micrarchaeota archaeon]